MISGGGFMVVMELVEGCDAYQKFKYKELPSAVMKDVELALKKLHDAGLVFGDLRRPNVMVYKPQGKDDEEWRGLLVDFDWAGPVGEVKYPPMLNKKISWPGGVDAETEIKKDHDLQMLKRLRDHVAE
jgi:RIO-like serine/threonine protein kinase